MTIWVKNLPFDVSDEDLLKLFAPFGTITYHRIRRYQGAAQDAYVDMPDSDQAAAAILGLNKTKLGGCTIICQPVNEAQSGRYGGPGLRHSPRFQ
jgi:RNA recognition motif-containing protein